MRSNSWSDALRIFSESGQFLVYNVLNDFGELLLTELSPRRPFCTGMGLMIKICDLCRKERYHPHCDGASCLISFAPGSPIIY